MNLDRERRQLVFHIKTAQTPDHVRAAKKAVKAWMSKHPEDAVVERAARELAAKEAWLRKKGRMALIPAYTTLRVGASS